MRTRPPSSRSTRSSSFRSPARPGLAPCSPWATGPASGDTGGETSSLVGRLGQQRGHVACRQHRRLARDFTRLPSGQPQAAGHPLQANLPAVLVGTGRHERPTRNARGSRGRRAASGARPSGAGPRWRPARLRGGRRQRVLRADRALDGEAVVAAEAGHRPPRVSAPARRAATIRRMRTAVVSDLHLGSLGGTDLASTPAYRRRLLEALEGADRVVLLGDVLEERERPLAELLAVERELLRRARRRHRGRPRDDRPRQSRSRPRRPLADRSPARGRRARGRTGVARRARPGRRRADRRPPAGQRAHARLSGAVAAPGRLRHARPLPRPPPHGPAAGVDRGFGDDPNQRAPGRLRLGRRLRGGDGADLRVLRRARPGRLTALAGSRQPHVEGGLAAGERLAGRLPASCSAG